MIEVQGADQLARLAKQLKEAADKDLPRELAKGIREAVKPAKAAVRKSALDKLPSRGGLNKLVADRVSPRISRSRRSGRGQGEGVRLVAIGKAGMKQVAMLNRGFVRHPVYANPEKARTEWTWVGQRITPGFWSEPLEALAPEIRNAVLTSMDEVARKIGRGL